MTAQSQIRYSKVKCFLQEGVYMRPSRWFGTILATALTLGGVTISEAQAVRLSDGQVYFVHPPRLITASATQTLAYFTGSTYFFTLEVPSDAGEPLQRVAIAQRYGNASTRRILYDTEDTTAFIGTRRNRDSALTLGETTFDSESRTVTVNFAPPVPPGNTITIALRVDRNPPTGGVYLFGVTAFPAGEPAYGQFLGYGRLQFDEPERSVPFSLFH